MTEPGSPLLDEAFTAFRDEVYQQVAPRGPDVVRSTVRRRRRVTLTTAVAAALALVGGPVAAYATLGGGAPTPAPAGSGGSTPAVPSPSVGPAATPSGTPTGPDATVGPARSGADGRISRRELLRSRVDLPAWRRGPSCPTRNARLTGLADDEGEVTLAALAYADVDADGSTETVVLLRCLLDQGGPAQVVALQRNSAGRIVPLGQVVRSHDGPPQWLLDLDTLPDGSVRVEVADLAPGGRWPLEWSQRQWRTYRWDGAGFRQVDGPTAFPGNPHLVDLSVTADDVTLSTVDGDGWRHGVVTVRISNAGPVDAAGVRLDLDLGAGVALRAGSGWSDCAAEDSSPVPASVLSCESGPLAAGEARTLVLGLVTGAARPDVDRATVTVSLSGSAGGLVEEIDTEDNRATFSFR